MENEWAATLSRRYHYGPGVTPPEDCEPWSDPEWREWLRQEWITYSETEEYLHELGAWRAREKENVPNPPRKTKSTEPARSSPSSPASSAASDWVPVSTAAELLHATRSEVWAHISAGELEYQELNEADRVSEASLTALLALRKQRDGE